MSKTPTSTTTTTPPADNSEEMSPLNRKLVYAATLSIAFFALAVLIPPAAPVLGSIGFILLGGSAVTYVVAGALKIAHKVLGAAFKPVKAVGRGIKKLFGKIRDKIKGKDMLNPAELSAPSSPQRIANSQSRGQAPSSPRSLERPGSPATLPTTPKSNITVVLRKANTRSKSARTTIGNRTATMQQPSSPSKATRAQSVSSSSAPLM